MHIRTSVGFVTALIVGILLLPQALFASAYCVQVSNGKIQGACSENAGPPDCNSAPPCSTDQTSATYCEVIQSEKKCADVIAAPGCCVCGASPNAGIGSESACKAKCGAASPKFFQASACSGKLIDDYVKSQSTVAAGGGGGAIKIGNPLGTTRIPVVIGRIINIFLSMSGSIALFMFVYGGFTWITSGGAPDKITQGKNTMVWATIGIAFIFLSYAVLSYILKILQG